MNAQGLFAQMVDRFHEITPHKDYRGYVGMSGIGGCLYDLYMRARHAMPPNDRLKWYGFTGALHEAAVKRLIQDEIGAIATFLGYPDPAHEIVADFDDRYRGHYDAVLRDGTLIEVKSVNDRRIELVKMRGKPMTTHIAQVQAYMRHGGFDHCVVIYICRDRNHGALFRPAPPWLTFDVARDDAIGHELDEYARWILEALDGKALSPQCTCNYCAMNWQGVE